MAVSAKTLQGEAGPGTASSALELQPLQQSAATRTARVATQLTGQLADSESAFDAGNLQLSLSGRVASLPAGAVIANFKFAFQYQGFDTQDAFPGSALTSSNLVRTIRRQISAGVSIGPFAGATTVLAHYEQTRSHDAIGALPPTTATLELAFPDGYVRDAGGNLILVDDRWVNLARQSTDDLKWGVTVWIPLGESTPRTMPNRVEFSLFDTWYLHDVTMIRNGVPELDLLDGAPSDITGGQPRHQIEFHTLVHKNGFGVLLAAAWRSSTVVGSGDASAPDAIRVSALGTADVRVFADFGCLPMTRNHEWANGTRLSFSVINIADTRQQVRDAAGATPTAFLPGYLDPPGRVLAIAARKLL